MISTKFLLIWIEDSLLRSKLLYISPSLITKTSLVKVHFKMAGFFFPSLLCSGTMSWNHFRLNYLISLQLRFHKIFLKIFVLKIEFNFFAKLHPSPTRNYFNPLCSQTALGTIPILLQQRDWVGGVRKVAIFADVQYYLCWRRVGECWATVIQFGDFAAEISKWPRFKFKKKFGFKW